jgi:hypothetical protein
MRYSDEVLILLTHSLLASQALLSDFDHSNVQHGLIIRKFNPFSTTSKFAPNFSSLENITVLPKRKYTVAFLLWHCCST